MARQQARKTVQREPRTFHPVLFGVDDKAMRGAEVASLQVAPFENGVGQVATFESHPAEVRTGEVRCVHAAAHEVCALEGDPLKGA